ncbi:molybdopterin-binding protein [Streptomyces cyaneofuscatus]|uniref:molybdopterin-binding protein n=1 Tax=Streptomyces cyaneofuscatus TaxID=66883 RepID=UPI00378E8BE3
MPSYSIGQAAELLAASPETVRRWADGGHLAMDRGSSGNRLIDGVSLAQVEIQSGPHRLVSLISRESAEELGLGVGVLATARVKSTDVHIDRPGSRPRAR